MPTPAVSLRPLSIKDTDAVYAITSLPQAAQYMRFSTHTAKEQAAALITAQTTEGNVGYAILSEDDLFAGYITLQRLDEHPGEYSLSTMLSPDYWNKGYSTEVLALVKEIAKNELHAVRLIAWVVGSNKGSMRVMEKSGFHMVRRIDFPDMPCGLFVFSFEV